MYNINKVISSECGIYVVDNNSVDGTKNILNSIKNINLTLLEVNSGFAGGSNLGIKKLLKINIIFLLFNPDARIHANIIESLIDLSDKKEGLVGPIILDFYSEKIQSIGGTFNPLFSNFKISKKISHKNNFVRVDWILGAALLIRKEIILKCGYLDENFFPATFEDSTYCIKLEKRGLFIY